MSPTCDYPTESGPCSRRVPEDVEHCFMHSDGGPPAGHGAPTGNTNAVGNSGGGAPVGNTNAEKYGAWNDPLKEYERLEGEQREYADTLIEDILDSSKANLPPERAAVKARRLAVLMLQRSRGWVHAFIDDEPVVIRERDLEDGGTLVTPELNPAIKADFRTTSKQRKLERELRVFPSPDGRPCTEH